MKTAVKIETIKVSEIVPNENNPRIIKEDKFAKLVESIKTFPEMLQVRPLVIDENNVVLGGNMRLKACIEAGLKDLPVIRCTNWSEERKSEFIIKDNVGFGEWDWNILANEWDVHPLVDWGLDVWETEPEEVEGLTDEDDVPEAPEEPITKLGDVWILGEHRVMCGDSTSKEAVEILMDGEKADMVFTDPPYGIDVVKDNKVGADFGVAKKGVYSKVISDDTTETAKDFYDKCVELKMENFIIFGGNYFTNFLPFSDGWLIWNKRGDTGIRNTFADGEMAWCSFHTPIRLYHQLWNGMIREGEKDKRVHPTQKPIRMLSEIIKDHVKGNIIYDGFLGSGSILLASEQQGKKCYGMELDPKYCDVIVKRWEDFTGKKAHLEENEFEVLTQAT